MTGAFSHNLSQTRRDQLLAAVGSAPTVEEGTPEAVAYDWRDPHYFNEDQRNRLAAVMSQVAALVADTLTHFYNAEFSVTPASITEQFAGTRSNADDAAAIYCLAFGPEGGPPCGCLSLPAKTTLDWVTRLLGDAEAGDDSNRSLSALEESLLNDVATAVTQAFLAPLRAHHDLKPGSKVAKGGPHVAFESTEAVCTIVFQVKQTDSDETSTVSFVLSCDKLAPLVGKPLQLNAPPAQKVLSRMLMEHVYEMPVTITVRLASTKLRVGEVLDIGPHDTLLLDKALDESVELIIDKETVFRGRPAQSGGQYAVLITECTTHGKPEDGRPAAAS